MKSSGPKKAYEQIEGCIKVHDSYLYYDSQEFKTSLFQAPVNAKEQNQKLTIMRGICAFLNTKVGGTLYLGVDDLGYIKGADSDIAYMEKTAYGSYKGIDGYIRYITDEEKRHFDISMMTNIRWECTSHHRQGKLDIFRMTGDTPIPVKLQLTLLAKNVLVEEYPEAQKDLIPTTDDDRWILETEIYQMAGVGRFYMGLAGEIQIIEAEGLKDYARKYCKDHII